MNVSITVAQLLQLGYCELGSLSMSTSTVNTKHFLDALARWPALATSVRIRTDWDIETILRPEGRQLRFAVRPYFHGVFQKLVQQRPAAFAHVDRLVLPVSLKQRTRTPPCPPLVEKNRGIPLPALRTLILECSNIRPPEDADPLRECICGTFNVPRLARIEVLKAPGAAWDAALEIMGVADVVWLVETVLRCDDPGALEVFVDTASGISLDGDLEQLPLDLTVDVRGDLTPWEFMLRSHASRLITLDLHLQSKARISLALPAPLLEKLSIAAEYLDMLEISGDLFDQHPPRLRTLHLSRISVPSQCPAFSAVTDLTLRRSWAPLDHLFDVMPRLEVLHIDMDCYRVHLPALPRSSPLRVLRLVDARVSLERLIELGYSGLDVLDVTTSTSNTSQFVDALSFWSESPATVRVRADWEFEIVPEAENRRLVRFAVRPYKWDIFHQIFCDGHAVVHHIQRLALPMSYGYRPCDPLASVLLGRNSVLTLPGLRTLVLECGVTRSGEKASPLRGCFLGTIEAPQITRIEIVRAADAPWDSQLDVVEIEELVAIVENVLVCDDRGALEIFVDTAAGIVLGGDVDPLRKCVGRVFV